MNHTDYTWTEVNFDELKKGDVFTLQDPPEMTYVKWKGSTVFHALSDAYFDEEFQELTILMENYEGVEQLGTN